MFGEKIKELRELNGYSMDKLVENYNKRFNGKMNKSTLSRYENGLQEPMYNVVVNLAKFFNVSTDYLVIDNEFITPEISKDTVDFPVIGEIAAGYNEDAFEDWTGETVEIPLSYLKGREKSEFFVLCVRGNSMYPMYQDGDKVLILKQSTLNRSGEVGAIIYEDNMATLKKIEYEEGKDWLRLIPINPEFMPKKIENEDLEHCRVIGIPKLLIREFV